MAQRTNNFRVSRLQSVVVNLWVRFVQVSGDLHRRFLAAIFGIIGPRAAYRVTGYGARLLYFLLDPLRARSEAQCRAALQGRVANELIPAIAAASFVNRARNLTDLMLAPRLLRPATYKKYGGQIAEPYLSELLAGQRRGQPTILLTAYYGAFDLLPILLGYNGIRATAVYLPHSNVGFDRYRKRIRAQSGSEMVPVQLAAARINEVLGQGGVVALLTDHHLEERGMPVTFLGIDTKVSRSVGLLAWRHQADVVVAAIRRLDDTFRFEINVLDVIYYADAGVQADPVEFITLRYVAALERQIVADPTQYLWAHARWGQQYARRIVEMTEEKLDLKNAGESTVAG